MTTLILSRGHSIKLNTSSGGGYTVLPADCSLSKKSIKRASLPFFKYGPIASFHEGSIFSKALAQAEEDNDDEERKQIINAVAQIRNNTRGNVLLLQHNIEFGFMRNLIGSSLLAFLISGFSIYYFHELEINLVITSGVAKHATFKPDTTQSLSHATLYGSLSSTLESASTIIEEPDAQSIPAAF